ncbi:hypothetical protein SAMN05421767_1078 [Granulicatella balaenopterae]|uniref:YdbS-like PH domain-containing protein n=1 Tax=Granulicatella balaenopterae TaxID=137733 RepID=A0A1H9IX62_9LACT|nr:PH domain-containing protein [Granulicatella balaenopterae]SEQ79174.1 hypothetical protein SAMN05421767_1078 [Granulicatella balaenopterae]
MDYINLSKNARKSLAIKEAIWAIIAGIIVSVISLVINAFTIPETVRNVVAIIKYLVFAYIIFEWVLDFTVGFKHKKYRITSESVEYLTGVIFVSRTIIPIRRIQQVELSEGFVNRHFKLANVNLITAGGELEIEYLDQEVAEQLVVDLKEVINQFAKEDAIAAKQQAFCRLDGEEVAYTCNPASSLKEVGDENDTTNH